MIIVYVIESLADQTWYTGMAKDADKRLKEHNAGKNRFTKGHLPWEIIYTEKHSDWASGRAREKYLKSAAGKKWLRIIYIRKDVKAPCPNDFGQAGIPFVGTIFFPVIQF